MQKSGWCQLRDEGEGGDWKGTHKKLLGKAGQFLLLDLGDRYIGIHSRIFSCTSVFYVLFLYMC